MTFTRRVVSGILLVLLVSVLLLLWMADRALRTTLESEVAEALRREALVVRGGLPADPEAAQAWLHRVSGETGHRITLVAEDGTVVGESDYDSLPLPPIENHADRAEVRAALAGSPGVGRRRSATVGRALLYVAVRGGPGVVRVAADLGQVDRIVHRAQLAVGAAAAIALLVGAIVAWFTARSVTRPLVALAASARSIAAGAQPHFPHAGIRDIDALVQSLRQMHHDLGDRFEALRQERAESAALVGSMVEGVVAADSHGRVVMANPAARQLLGYGAEAAIPDLPHLFRTREAQAAVRRVVEGAAVDGVEMALGDRLVVLSGRPLPDAGAILVLHDQTELRRLEAVRRDFVANVSHELKTPLTSIAGYSETLLAGRPGVEVERQFLATILANARRMQRLVDDLLDLARIESGGWEPRRIPADVRAVAAEVWADFASRAGERGVAFSVETPPNAPTLLADPEGLRVVLRNLLDNALRYTPPGGTIVVRSRAADDGVVLEVADTGSGIPHEHLDRVFERFYRADPSRSRAEGGTGLGLSIVRRTVEAHGGHVAAASEVGGGTTITCWFPGGGGGAVTNS